MINTFALLPRLRAFGLVVSPCSFPVPSASNCLLSPLTARLAPLHSLPLIRGQSQEQSTQERDRGSPSQAGSARKDLLFQARDGGRGTRGSPRDLLPSVFSIRPRKQEQPKIQHPPCLPRLPEQGEAPGTFQIQVPGVHPNKAAPGGMGTGWGSSPRAPSGTRQGFFSAALFPEAPGWLNTLRNGKALEAALLQRPI